MQTVLILTCFHFFNFSHCSINACSNNLFEEFQEKRLPNCRREEEGKVTKIDVHIMNFPIQRISALTRHCSLISLCAISLRDTPSPPPPFLPSLSPSRSLSISLSPSLFLHTSAHTYPFIHPLRFMNVVQIMQLSCKTKQIIINLFR